MREDGRRTTIPTASIRAAPRAFRARTCRDRIPLTIEALAGSGADQGHDLDSQLMRRVALTSEDWRAVIAVLRAKRSAYMLEQADHIERLLLEQHGPDESPVALSLTDDIYLRSYNCARWQLGIPSHRTERQRRDRVVVTRHAGVRNELSKDAGRRPRLAVIALALWRQLSSGR